MSNIIYINDEKFVECPYCHHPYKSLVRHIPYTHNISLSDFHKAFPNWVMQIGQIKEDSYSSKKEKYLEYYSKYKEGDSYKCPECGKIFKNISGLHEHCLSHGIELPTRDSFECSGTRNEEFKCDLCGESFKNKQGLSVHISVKHPVERAAEKLKLEENKKGFTCPICGKKFGGLKDHVRSKHDISWEDFVKKYNWIYGGMYFSADHKKNLSFNKKKFYASDAGTTWRTNHSKNSKLSDYEGIYNTCRSYYFSSLDDSFENCRSFQEYSIIYMLRKNNINYKYEPFYINYIIDGVQHRYKPDLLVGNTLYEIKSEEREFEVEKYERVLEVLKNSKFELKLLTRKTCSEVFDIPEVSNVEVYHDIKNRFFENGNFFIHGLFVFNQKKGKESSLLKTIFEKDYDRFVEDNLKRIEKFNENYSKENH